MTRPRDVFQEGIERIYESLQDYGYKQLKSGSIKKKRGKLTCLINFGSSHYNYIADGPQKGSVVLEVYCRIELAGAVLYRFSFTEPRSAVRRFQLLGDGVNLNQDVIDYLVSMIRQHFVAVVEGLATDPKNTIVNLGLVPEVQADDYSWAYTVDRGLLEYFELTELLPEYDRNRQDYDQVEQVVARNHDSYLYLMKTRVNTQFCKRQERGELLRLIEDVYRFLQATDAFTERTEANYQYVKSRAAQYDLVELTITAFSFVNTCLFSWEPDDPAVQTMLAQKQRLYDGMFND